MRERRTAGEAFLESLASLLLITMSLLILAGAAISLARAGETAASFGSGSESLLRDPDGRDATYAVTVTGDPAYGGGAIAAYEVYALRQPGTDRELYAYVAKEASP